VRGCDGASVPVRQCRALRTRSPAPSHTRTFAPLPVCIHAYNKDIVSSDHHELGPADAGRYARDVRGATDRVLEEVRASLDSTLPLLADTIATHARASERRFFDAMRRMDEAPSLRGVLYALMEAVAGEAERSALLVMSQRKLRGWTSSGFPEAAADPMSLDLPFDPGGLVGAAIRTKSMISSSASTLAPTGAERPHFAQGPERRDAIAVPVVLGGAVAAVLYADALSDGEPPAWADRVNRLVRYAALQLETRTARYLITVHADVPVASGPVSVRGASGGVR
jgi:hypothetical protein